MLQSEKRSNVAACHCREEKVFVSMRGIAKCAHDVYQKRLKKQSNGKLLRHPRKEGPAQVLKLGIRRIGSENS